MEAATLKVASIKKTCYNRDIYEPSDDSFVLVDALQLAAETWAEDPPRLCVEVGCGSGYVICSLALLLSGLGGGGLGSGRDGSFTAQCFATDLNQAAALATAETLQQHGVHSVDVVQCDLVGPMLRRLEGKVDVLVFNPPYVPTPDEEVDQVGGIAAAWAGGHRGRRVTDRLLHLVGTLLSSRGEFFLVTVPDNDPGEIQQLMLLQGLQGGSVIERAADEELLSVMHFKRVNPSLAWV